MSSDTQIEIEPSLTNYTVTESKAVPLEQILGRGGAEFLRHTLVGLPAVAERLGEKAVALRDWQRVPGSASDYVRDIATESVRVLLRLRGTYAELWATAIRMAGTAESAPQGLSPSQAAAVTYCVNQLLAVALAGRVEARLQEYLTTRMEVVERQPVYQMVANTFTLRVNGCLGQLV
jgi:hypothetical protein